MVVPEDLAQAVLVPSPPCGVTDLADAWEVPEAARRELTCAAGWENRGEASWRRDGGAASGRVSDLGQVLAGGASRGGISPGGPASGTGPGCSSWCPRAVITGSSLEEQRFLLALDFAGDVTDVVSQPFWLRAETTAGLREHIPSPTSPPTSPPHGTRSTSPGSPALPRNSCCAAPPLSTSPAPAPRPATASSASCCRSRQNPPRKSSQDALCHRAGRDSHRAHERDRCHEQPSGPQSAVRGKILAELFASSCPASGRPSSPGP
jgi:hypothetical protein